MSLPPRNDWKRIQRYILQVPVSLRIASTDDPCQNNVGFFEFRACESPRSTGKRNQATREYVFIFKSRKVMYCVLNWYCLVVERSVISAQLSTTFIFSLGL